ncbi:transporter [Luteolibacter yonseiensis]|uniref:Transporter n=1 Tax=Luteolibacter yonseiensis TaxID=1144680 RepID=A0A934VC73_9BACT|nr:transporter [Luteolibacter yonseiensis]MBK1816189.1 transporter [Luteolibacter yonseiensis]
MKPHNFILHSAITLGLCVPLHAEEGGAGRYIPGNSATLIDLPPTKPGWIAETMYLHYSGDASASGNFPNAGLVTAGLDAKSDAFTVGGFYTFETPVLEARYSVGAYVPYLWMDVDADVVAGGTTGSRSDSADGIGDVALIPVIMAWKCDDWQYSALLPIYAPTGDYDTGSLANVGRNYWTFDPTFQVSYNNAKSGFNTALFTGVTLNTENEDTDYKSGTAFHADLSVQQLLPLGPGFLSVGFNAFYYDQIDGDSGSGATLGDFEGRDVGVGPALGYILPVGGNTFVSEIRWLPELDTRRRLEGDFFWAKVAWQF